MAYVRCSYCGGRRTTSMPLQEYYRLPICRTPGCNGKRKRLGKPVSYRVDKYRTNVERSGKIKPCHPGMGGCDGYPFPHRKGSKQCIHNPNYENVMKEINEESPAWND